MKDVFTLAFLLIFLNVFAVCAQQKAQIYEDPSPLNSALVEEQTTPPVADVRTAPARIQQEASAVEAPESVQLTEEQQKRFERIQKKLEKKVNKKADKAKKAYMNSYVLIGIILMAVGLILALLPVVSIIGIILLIVGLVFLILGLVG